MGEKATTAVGLRKHEAKRQSVRRTCCVAVRKAEATTGAGATLFARLSYQSKHERTRSGHTKHEQGLNTYAG